MKKSLYIAICIVCSILLLGKEANSNPYEEYFRHFINGKEVRSSYSDALKSKPINGLSERALDIHLKALTVYKSPTNEAAKINYLKSFPIDFNLFLEVFHSPKFDQLYDGHIYIHLFRLLADEHPKLAAPTLLALAKDACFDADAPNYLRETLIEFKLHHSKLYETQFQKLSESEKTNVDLYLKASFHPHSNLKRIGLCSF